MRVLMVSDVYFPRINGVSTSIETFRRTLGEHGIEVRLIAPHYGGEPDEPEVTRVPGRSVPGSREDRLPSWGAMRRAALSAAVDCDAVHIQTPFVAHYVGLEAARAHALPVLATYHTLFEEYLRHYVRLLPLAWLQRHARRLSRRQCNALDAVVVPSAAIRQRLADYGVTAPVHVLPTGVPLQRFSDGDGAGFRRQHGIDPARPVLLYVGRVAHEKNIGFLLDATAHVRRERPDVLLVVAGEGPALQDLREDVERRGLARSVLFVGYLGRLCGLPACYAAADLFVFASRTETQGLVLLEAMASGLPVVALAEMGTVDILAPARGSVSPPADPRAFGRAIADLLGRGADRQRLADEARRHAAGWSDAAAAGRLAALYRELVERAAQTRAVPVPPLCSVAGYAAPPRPVAGVPAAGGGAPSHR